MIKINFEEVAHTTTEEYFSEGGDFSIDIYKSKYPNDDIEKQFPVKLFWRIARTAASYEKTPELQEYWSQRWFSELWRGMWRPGGSVLAGLGIDGKISISNCTTIALDEDNVYVLYDSLYFIPKDIIVNSVIDLDQKSTGGYAAWVILGSLSTISNGKYLAITFPLWLIAGIPTAAGESYRDMYAEEYPDEIYWGNINKFSRFPQGVESINLSDIQPIFSDIE